MELTHNNKVGFSDQCLVYLTANPFQVVSHPKKKLTTLTTFNNVTTVSPFQNLIITKGIKHPSKKIPSLIQLLLFSSSMQYINR